MTQEIRDLVPPACELLGLGEPTHQEPAFALIRNELFAQLVELGFRSIVLETDRVAAFAVDDFVRAGTGTLDTAMDSGFSHGFGALDANRQLVGWLRDYNRDRPPAAQLSFHGFDTPSENYSAPSPRRYLEYARDYLGLDLDLSDLLGPDECWSRSAAVLDPAESPGATPAADRLRLLADDMALALRKHASDLIATSSRAEWRRAAAYLDAGIGLLRYHGAAARRLTTDERITLLLATRDALMAQNLLEIRDIEARRGPTLVFAHNLHLRQHQSRSSARAELPGYECAGAIIGSLLDDEQYACIIGSLGSSAALGLAEPAPDTHESFLQSRTSSWGLLPAATPEAARTRTDPEPRQGYFPLDHLIVEQAAALLHVRTGVAS
ncbi:erythromycin esterase family protein [Nocardia brasiliensis]|uniref:erythromycin esterase family protein n=1 Tax=Nocardia brasiliensis TaxID=37326 RepID=UPI001895FDF9|nr:erythromycin esterase family protein [Nocardia brasiliensis]MBF6543266.1 erythromycin esterase family protein [Nocardia brasiliensis]